MRAGSIVSGLIVAVGLSGCDSNVEVVSEPQVRSIKYMVLDRRAGDQGRRIAGVVTAAVTSKVAFEIPGQVVELYAKSGDRVEKGDLLARLDSELYELQLAQAQNSLAQAQAGRDDAQQKYTQQQKLHAKGFAPKTSLDSAEATLKNTRGAVGVAKSQLDLARRDLAKTELKAPFDGVVARKLVEVFEDVQTGQEIYALQTDAEDKVEASVPETLITKISVGSVVSIRFPPLGGVTVQGRVDEVSPLTGDANAYPVEVALDSAPTDLRPGMSAEIVFTFSSDETGKAFVLPIGAVLPDARDEADGQVFVYDPDEKILHKRSVSVVNLSNNELHVLGELKEGEIIATAGVSFLHEGMRVELFDPAAWR